jgi:hypothetical protein
MTEILILWALHVLNALLWSALALAVLGAITLTIGLCRAASLDDGEVAADLEIDR